MSKFIRIREVGLRDGLQLSRTRISYETKIKWIKRQCEAGFREMEVTSFVPPSLLPQFSDAQKVVDEANKIEDLIPSVLVPNLKGGLNALKSHSKKILFVISASEQHNLSNVNCDIKQSLLMFNDLIKERKNSGLDKSLNELPLEHLLLETDSPYLAPTPHRGQRNESSYIPLMAQKLAEIYE